MKQALDELQVFWVPARNSRHQLRLVELAIAPHEAKKGLAFDPRELSGKFDDDAFIFTKDRGGINRMEQAISPRAQKAMGGTRKKDAGLLDVGAQHNESAARALDENPCGMRLTTLL